MGQAKCLLNRVMSTVSLPLSLLPAESITASGPGPKGPRRAPNDKSASFPESGQKADPVKRISVSLGDPV